MTAKKFFVALLVLFMSLLAGVPQAYAERKIRSNTDVMKDTKLNLSFRGRSDLDKYLKERRNARKALEAERRRDVENYAEERQTRFRREKDRVSEIRRQARYSWRDKIINIR